VRALHRLPQTAGHRVQHDVQALGELPLLRRRGHPSLNVTVRQHRAAHCAGGLGRRERERDAERRTRMLEQRVATPVGGVRLDRAHRRVGPEERDVGAPRELAPDLHRQLGEVGLPGGREDGGPGPVGDGRGGGGDASHVAARDHERRDLAPAAEAQRHVEAVAVRRGRRGSRQQHDRIGVDLPEVGEILDEGDAPYRTLRARPHDEAQPRPEGR
jgi:hypothetical protein